jgi:hypothetical protein
MGRIYKMATNYPTWLPTVISTNGDWNQVLNNLYKVFSADIKNGRLTFRNCPVWWDRKILLNSSYEEAFWHITHRDDPITKQRIFDPRRSEKLSWFGPLIRNCQDPIVKAWDYHEGRKIINSYIWLEPFDYVICLNKKVLRLGEVYFLVTAYHVDGNSRRRSLTQKYNKRI